MVFNFFHARKTREVLRESKGKIYFVTNLWYNIFNKLKNRLNRFIFPTTICMKAPETEVEKQMDSIKLEKLITENMKSIFGFALSFRNERRSSVFISIWYMTVISIWRRKIFVQRIIFVSEGGLKPRDENTPEFSIFVHRFFRSDCPLAAWKYKS